MPAIPSVLIAALDGQAKRTRGGAIHHRAARMLERGLEFHEGALRLWVGEGGGSEGEWDSDESAAARRMCAAKGQARRGGRGGGEWGRREMFGAQWDRRRS